MSHYNTCKIMRKNIIQYNMLAPVLCRLVLILEPRSVVRFVHNAIEL